MWCSLCGQRVDLELTMLVLLDSTPSRGSHTLCVCVCVIAVPVYASASMNVCVRECTHDNVCRWVGLYLSFVFLRVCVRGCVPTEDSVSLCDPVTQALR